MIVTALQIIMLIPVAILALIFVGLMFAFVLDIVRDAVDRARRR